VIYGPFLGPRIRPPRTPRAVDSVLQIAAAGSPSSSLIFPYIHSGLLDGSKRFKDGERLLRDFVRIGEPWTFGLHPLRERGLCLQRDLSARAYRSQYFGVAAQRIKGHEFYHVALARVP